MEASRIWGRSMERRSVFPKENEQELRRRHKGLREQMTKAQREEADRRICERLLSALWYDACTWIYGYYPLGAEADCLWFLERALADHKHVALPRVAACGADADCRMDFYEIASTKQVRRGHFGVLEPLEACILTARQDAVVLVPGVVFDRRGNRYGYGKGYYDRYFSRFPKLFKIGIAYEHQLEEALLVKDTDVRMDGIYTEQGCYFG